MSYSKDPSFYPSEFLEIFRRAISNESEVVAVECDSHAEATSLRHQFHAYRRAAEIHQITGWTDLRKITIKLDKKTLTFVNNIKLLESLRKAANTAKPTEDELDEYLQQMEERDG